MNREIKFRAYIAEYKKMYPVISVFSKSDGEDFERFFILRTPEKGERLNYGSKKDKHFLMQYTGLKDKNGVEIYEGDIIKGNHHDNFYIDNINGGSQMVNMNYYGQKHNELIAMPTCDPQTKSWLKNSEVIGNIHQNSELLNLTSPK